MTTWLTLLLIIVISRDILSSGGKLVYREGGGFWGKRVELNVIDGFVFFGDVMLKLEERSLAVWNLWKFIA